MRLIDAEAFREQLSNSYEYTELDEIIEMLDNAPTVERPTGKWIDIDSFVSKARCSKCKNIMLTEPFGKTNYCPNCGAKMKGGVE